MSGALARTDHEFDRLPPVEAGCAMPTHRAILAQDAARARDAIEGSIELAARLRRLLGGP